jgi:HEAT repeat protein
MRFLSLLALVLLTFGLSSDPLSGQGKDKDKDPKKDTDARLLTVFGKDLSQYIQDLQDPDPSTRQTACWAICQFGSAGRKAVPAIASRLSINTEPDNAVRASAAIALGTLGADKADMKTAVSALSEALGDGQRAVRLQAAFALAHLGHDAKGAVGKLASALQDPVSWEMRQAAARALGAVGHTDKPERNADLTALSALLNALPDASATVRMEVVIALFGIGHPPEKQLPGELKTISDRLGRERDHRVRIWLRVLLMMLDEKNHMTAGNFAIIAKSLAAEEDTRVRAQACYAMGTFGEKARDHVPLLIKAADASDPEVSLAALHALAQVGSPASIKLLTERLTRETEPLPVRIQIALSAYLLGEKGKALVGDLTALLTHRDPDLVGAAIRGLGSFGYWAKPSMQALKTFAAETKNEYLKHAANDAIKTIDNAVKPPPVKDK